MVVSTLFLLGTILLILQTTLLHALPDWMGRPDLLFLLIVFLGSKVDIYKGAMLALFFGLMMDIFSGIFLGLHPVVYLFLFFTLKGIAHHLVINEAVHQVPLVVLSYLFAASGIYIFSSMLAPDTSLSWGWGNHVLQMLILAVICMPFFSLFEWVTEAFDRSNHHPFGRSRSSNRFL